MSKNPTTVYLKMKTAEGKIAERSIDISCILVHSGSESRIAQSEEKQRELINDWIKYRGNPQHETKLTLIGWTVA